METLNDDDQLQQLREWWKQNWQPILLGLVLSVGGVLGWNAWQSHRQEQAALASGHFEQLRLSLASANLDAAQAARQRLVDDYPSSVYAAQAALTLAHYFVGDGRYEDAAAQLQWAASHAGDKRLKQLATLRLARVRWALGDDEAALELLKPAKGSAFASLAAELRGDILLAQGDTDAARDAYEQALILAAEDEFAADAGISNAGLQTKLDDLGRAPVPAKPQSPGS